MRRRTLVAAVCVFEHRHPGTRRHAVPRPRLSAWHFVRPAAALRARLQTLRLRQSLSAQGRRHARAADGHVRQLQRHHRDRSARGGLRRDGEPRLRPAARRQHRRAGERLCAPRRWRRGRDGLPLDRLSSAIRRPLARRATDHPRRPTVHLRRDPGARLGCAAHRARRPRPRRRLRGTGAVLRHPRRCRAEPDPAVRLRSHRHPAEALLGVAGHLEDRGNSAARERPVPPEAGGVWSHTHLRARTRLLGTRSAGE